MSSTLDKTVEQAMRELQAQAQNSQLMQMAKAQHDQQQRVLVAYETIATQLTRIADHVCASTARPTVRIVRKEVEFGDDNA